MTIPTSDAPGSDESSTPREHADVDDGRHKSRPAGADVFARNLHALFAAAGQPTLASVVAAVHPIAPVSRQRLSNWRSGRHLPAHYTDIEPVLAYLITTAEMPDVNLTPATPDLLDLASWRTRWEAAVATTSVHRGESTPSSVAAAGASARLQRGLSKSAARMVIGLLIFFVFLLAAAAAAISALLY